VSIGFLVDLSQVKKNLFLLIMKIVGAAVLVISGLPCSAAFVGPLIKRPQTSALNLMLGPDTPIEVIAGMVVIY
jgi:hypothetical protein